MRHDPVNGHFAASARTWRQLSLGSKSVSGEGFWSLSTDLCQRKTFLVSDEIEMRIGRENSAVVSERDGGDCKVGQW